MFIIYLRGKIRYCTVPPEERPDDEIHLGAKIVQEISKEFDISSFEPMEMETLKLLDLEHKSMETTVPVLEREEKTESMNIDGDESEGIVSKYFKPGPYY